MVALLVSQVWWHCQGLSWDCVQAQVQDWAVSQGGNLWVPGIYLELPSLPPCPRLSGVFRALGWLSQGPVQAAWRLSVALCWVPAASAEPLPED